MRGERGQTAVEYLGALLVVSVLIAGVATSDVGERVRAAMRTQVCKIAGGDCAAPHSSGGTRALARAASKPPKQTFHGVPLAPSPPPLPAGDGGASGDWGTKGAGLKGRAIKILAGRLADAAEAIGYEDAARHLRHYLSNSGDPLGVDPRRLLRDIDMLGYEAGRTRLQMVKQLQRRLRKTYDGTTTYAYEYGTPWRAIPSDPAVEGKNWFYALGGFSYSYTARATARPNPKGGDPIVTVEYRLHVFDRYNWDTGKSVTIGPVTVKDEVLGDLNKRGLAKNFEVHGTTGVDSTTFGLHQKITVPPPSAPAGDRDGERSDPGRDRGR
jgi:hypothetical protein